MSISDQIQYELFDEEDVGVTKEKAYSKSAVLIRLLKMMKKGFWIYLVVIIAMSIAMSGFDMVVAFFLKEVISMAQSGDISNLWMEFAKNFFLGIACLLTYQVSFYIYTIEAKKGCANVQNSIVEKAMRLPFAFYENNHSGDFMSTLMYDGSRTEDVYGSRFRRILMPTLMVICYLIPMFMLSWQLTSCLFGISIVLFVINTVFINPMQKVSKELSKTHTKVSESLSNVLSGMEIVKMFSLDKKMTSEYIKYNNQYKDEQKKMNKLAALLEAFNNCFDLISSLVFVAVGIFFISHKITTVDTLAAVYVLYGNMSWNFLQIGIYIPSMAGVLTNAERVLQFIDKEEEPASYEGVGTTEQDSYIAMEHIDFSYDGVNKILKDFSLHIEKGKTVALKGESGKGKSTIAKLLLGFYAVQKGGITIDGKAFSDMSLEEVRGMIGYVPQEPYLYDVSIAENIRYGKPDATMEEIIAAAKAANAHDFILKHEKGYEANAGERGNKLSGGEKQRIAIARAVLKNAPILILDEATSALDNESERLVSEALENLMKDRTTIMIAHRTSTLERADVIVEI